MACVERLERLLAFDLSPSYEDADTSSWFPNAQQPPLVHTHSEKKGRQLIGLLHSDVRRRPSTTSPPHHPTGPSPYRLTFRPFPHLLHIIGLLSSGRVAAMAWGRRGRGLDAPGRRRGRGGWDTPRWGQDLSKAN